jgi:predicted nucleotidyltransferase
MKTIEQWEPKTASVQILRRCKDALRRVLPRADLILYGSRARGDAQDTYADYDLLILTDEKDERAAEEKIREAFFPIEVETGAVLTLSVHNRSKWESPLYRVMPLRKNIEEDGVVI